MALRYLREEALAKICGATPPTPTQNSEAPGSMPSTEGRKSFRLGLRGAHLKCPTGGRHRTNARAAFWQHNERTRAIDWPYVGDL